MKLFIGDDWAIDHHDIEIIDAHGEKLAAERVPEGVVGLRRLFMLIAEITHRATPDLSQVHLCIEGDRGAWTQYLQASGLNLYVVNPLSASRFREAFTVSGAKSDKTDAHVLAELVRLDRNQRPRPINSDLATSLPPLTHAHQKLVQDRTAHINRLKGELRQYFPFAIEAYSKVKFTSNDGLQLLAMAPDPISAAHLDAAAISEVLRAGNRRNIEAHVDHIMGALAQESIPQSALVVEAHATVVKVLCGVLTVMNSSLDDLETVISNHFRRHPDYEIYISLPGISDLSGARLLAEYGDCSDRFPTSHARQNFSMVTPVTRQSGKYTSIQCRHFGNQFLASNIRQICHNATQSKSTGTEFHRFYDELTAGGMARGTALRRLGCRLVAILHACLKAHEKYDPAKAWKRYGNQSNGPILAAA